MGLILDSSVAITGERQRMSAADMLNAVRAVVGRVDIALSVVTIMELEHGIWREKEPVRAKIRRQFLDDLVGNVPVYPVTIEVARHAARVDAEQREKGIQIAAADLLIGVSALELNYAVGTSNVRHFERIPGLVVTKL